jgi:putative MFS transporter
MLELSDRQKRLTVTQWKIIATANLGSSDFISPKAIVDAIGPAFMYFAFWWVLGALTFWLIGFETKGRSIEEIDRALDRPLPISARPMARPAGD